MNIEVLRNALRKEIKHRTKEDFERIVPELMKVEFFKERSKRELIFKHRSVL